MRAAGILLAGVACLACGCGAESPVPPVPNKTVPEIPFEYEGRSLSAWKSLPADAPAEERAAAAWAMAALEEDPAQSVTVLLELLRAPEPSVRLAAAVAAGRLGLPSEEAARILVGWFDAPEEPLRRHARVAVGGMGAVALEPLGAVLGHETMRVRWAALVALRQLGAIAAELTDPIRSLAQSDPEPAVRRQALFTLARLGPTGIEVTLTFLRSPETHVRTEASAALVQAGDLVVKPLSLLLSDPDEELAALAGGILADLGPRAVMVMPALLRALSREGPVRFNAAEALIAIGPQAVSRLEPLAESPDEGVAAIARYALDEIKNR